MGMRGSFFRANVTGDFHLLYIGPRLKMNEGATWGSQKVPGIVV